MTDTTTNTQLLFSNVSNEEIELYKEDNRYFFRVDFDYEDDCAVYKGHIEKIPFNFRLIRLGTGYDDLTINKRCVVNLGLKENMEVLPDDKSCFFTLTVVKEKIHEMTIEEIEKKLGYKVSIVNKKSE